MKLTLLLPALVLGLIISTSSETLAFGGPPGGPFSNGSYFPTDGTFSAVVRGENLTGTLQFSTTSGAGTSTQALVGGGEGGTFLADTGRGLGSTGVATIYFDGDTYLGNSQGSLNAQASTMTVNFQAGVQGQGQNTIEVQTAVTVDVPNVITENGTTTVITTQETSFVPTREILYFDSLYLNGSANCKTSNAFPNQKFEGSGEAEFQQLVFTGDTPFLDAVTLPIAITGVRLSNTATSFNILPVRSPSVNEFSVLVP
jgi:hypothetical protein